MSISEILLYICILTTPLQSNAFSFRMGGSYLDIAVIFEFLLLIFSTFNYRIKWTSTTITLTTCYFLFNSLLYLITQYPLNRFLSASFFYLLHLLIITARFNISSQSISISIRNLLEKLTIFSSLYVIFQFFILDVRPYATFAEPSGAGLFILAYIVATIASKIQKNQYINMLNIIMLLITLFAFVLTKSMHLFSGILSLMLFFFIFQDFKITTNINIRRMLIISFGSLSLFTFIAFNLRHLIERINLFSVDLNLSQLSWLHGMSQSLYTLRNSPIFGFGFGSTGTFEYTSRFIPLMSDLGWANMNLKDAYSGLFRLIIETGLIAPLFIILTVLYIGRKIKSLSRVVSSHQSYSNIYSLTNYNNIIFIFVFGLTILIGVLFKEPVWSRSFLPLSIILVYVIPKIYFNDLIQNNQ